ncbi:MAG TPA: helix-turn-helix domain-containing protein [Firmicutes bacterium]|nr:helix-turn-helix domain-containing protein [Bacillota bacterium]
MYKRIKELREDRDLKQKEIADILCITQSTYSRYENGQLDIPSECLVKLAQFYEVSVDYLLGLTDQRN